jgi:hypothetical protein
LIPLSGIGQRKGPRRQGTKNLTKCDLSEPSNQKVCRQHEECKAGTQSVSECRAYAAFSCLLAKYLQKDEPKKSRNPNKKRQVKSLVRMIGWAGSEPQPPDHECFSQKHAQQRSREKRGRQAKGRPASGWNQTGHFPSSIDACLDGKDGNRVSPIASSNDFSECYLSRVQDEL